MVFNEILIPQDPFTETNVTRKRSVVENSHFYLERIKKLISINIIIIFERY